MTSNYLTLRELAAELGMDPSNLRRYVQKRDLPRSWARPRAARGMRAIVFTAEQAEAVRSARREDRYEVAVEAVR